MSLRAERWRFMKTANSLQGTPPVISLHLTWLWGFISHLAQWILKPRCLLALADQYVLLCPPKAFSTLLIKVMVGQFQFITCQRWLPMFRFISQMLLHLSSIGFVNRTKSLSPNKHVTKNTFVSLSHYGCKINLTLTVALWAFRTHLATFPKFSFIIEIVY